MRQPGIDFTVIDATTIAGVRDVLSNPRVITGHVHIAGVGQVPYEGPLERDFLESQAFRRTLVHAGSQPLQIQFQKDRWTRYTPDYLLRFRALGREKVRSPALYEIKPREELLTNYQDLRPGFLRAALLCRDRGWRFRIATERVIRTPKLINYKFLRGYLSRRDDQCIGQVLYLTMKKLKQATPSELIAASFTNKDTQMEAVAILWKLIAARRIRADLSRKLTMESPIWSIWHEPPR